MRDDGVGFDVETVSSGSSPIGLTSMRERAATTGGTFHVESTPGRGTTVEFVLP